MTSSDSQHIPNPGWIFATLILSGSLLAMTGLRQFFIDPLPNTTANAVWFAVQVLPLLGTLPGVLRGRLRSMFLLCLFSTLYFVHGVMVAFEGTLRLYGAFEIGFSLALCGVTAWYVRQLREYQSDA